MVGETGSAFPDLQVPHHYGLKEVLLIYCRALRDTVTVQDHMLPCRHAYWDAGLSRSFSPLKGSLHVMHKPGILKKAQSATGGAARMPASL